MRTCLTTSLLSLGAALLGCGADPSPMDAGGGTGASSGLGDAADGAPSASAVRQLGAPPVYRGSVDNSVDCSRQYATRGFEPDDEPGTRHPLFLYFTGTNFVLDEQSFREQAAPAVDAVTQAMAHRGFVALNVEYDNSALSWASDHINQLNCLFDAQPGNVLAAACTLPQVDCELGIATWGHSLGALVAHRAANHDERVRVAWLTGYGGDEQAMLAKNRLRVVNGQNDTTNGTVGVLNGIAGLTLAECPDDGQSACLRPDGSGWIIVRPEDCELTTADHCWFDRVTCTDATTTLEPNWIDPDSTKPFALDLNADWVAEAAGRP